MRKIYTPRSKVYVLSQTTSASHLLSLLHELRLRPHMTDTTEPVGAGHHKATTFYAVRLRERLVQEADRDATLLTKGSTRRAISRMHDAMCASEERQRVAVKWILMSVATGRRVVAVAARPDILRDVESRLRPHGLTVGRLFGPAVGRRYGPAVDRQRVHAFDVLLTDNMFGPAERGYDTVIALTPPSPAWDLYHWLPHGSDDTGYRIVELIDADELLQERFERRRWFLCHLANCPKILDVAQEDSAHPIMADVRARLGKYHEELIAVACRPSRLHQI